MDRIRVDIIILQDICNVFETGLDFDKYFKRNLDEDQDICLICITKFP